MPGLLISPTGGVLLVAPGGGGLSIGAAAAPVVVAPTGALPSAIAGLIDWWDASSLANLRDAANAAVTSYATVVGSVANAASGGTALTMTPGFGQWLAMPRLCGTLGGLASLRGPSYGPQAPVPDAAYSYATVPLTIGNNLARTLHFVWSRPNRRFLSFGSYITTACPIILVNGNTPLVTLTSNGTESDVLAIGSTVLSSSVPRRHTMSLTLRLNAGGTIDTWINGVAGPQGVANPLSAAASQNVILLGCDGTGSAGLYFHEAMVYDHALASADLATLFGSMASRWPLLGSRRVPTILGFGQSNAGNFMADAEGQFEEAVRYHLGALGVNFIDGGNRQNVSPAFNTAPGGTPLYSTGAWLVDPGTGTDPSTWANGNLMTLLLAYIAALDAPSRGDFAGIFAYYSEADSSSLPYSAKPIYESALLAVATRVRAAVGVPAAQLPLFGISALPYESGTWPGAFVNVDGTEMIRAAVADLAAVPANGVRIALPNTAASFPRGADANGVGGDGSHIDSADNIRHAYLAAPVVARALMAAGVADAGATALAGTPAVGGPSIVSAQRQSPTTVLVTVLHDAGTDLVLSANAAAGFGWNVFDGWVSEASPGASILIAGVARQSSTTLLLTLASAMTNPAANCRLFYPWGGIHVGRGDMVTDNYGAASAIAADLGAAWAPNCPLAVPPYGVALS